MNRRKPLGYTPRGFFVSGYFSVLFLVLTVISSASSLFLMAFSTVVAMSLGLVPRALLSVSMAVACAVSVALSAAIS